MALDPILWAMKDAPVKDPGERMVLMVMAEHADEDGCNAFPSAATIARYGLMDLRTVRRKMTALRDRGLIVEGDQRYPALLAIPPGSRPTNYDLMIPHSWFGNVGRTNAFRVGRGRPELTPQTRPDLAPAPQKKVRTDKGQTRSEAPVQTSDDSETAGQEGEGTSLRRGDYLSPPVSVSPLTESHPLSESQVRGDSESPEGVAQSHPTLPKNPPQDPPLLDGSPEVGQTSSAGADGSPAGSPKETEDTSTSTKKRGTRLPADFEVTPAMVTWAQTRCPDVVKMSDGAGGRIETEKFVNHFSAASGSRGVKLDWNATWRNWMLNAQQRIEQTRDAQAKRQGKAFSSTDVWGAPPDPAEPTTIPGLPTTDEGDDQWWVQGQGSAG